MENYIVDLFNNCSPAKKLSLHDDLINTARMHCPAMTPEVSWTIEELEEFHDSYIRAPKHMFEGLVADDPYSEAFAVGAYCGFYDGMCRRPRSWVGDMVYPTADHQELIQRPMFCTNYKQGFESFYFTSDCPETCDMWAYGAYDGYLTQYGWGLVQMLDLGSKLKLKCLTSSDIRQSIDFHEGDKIRAYRCGSAFDSFISIDCKNGDGTVMDDEYAFVEFTHEVGLTWF